MREREVDIAKGLCIICMIMVHISSWWGKYEWINKYTGVFFLVFFFFSSGFFYRHPDKPGKYIQKRAVRLVLPYVIVAGSILIYRYIKGTKNVELLLCSMIYALPADFTANPLLFGIGTIGIGPVWFLNALFVCNCAYLVLSHINMRLKGIVIIGIFVLAKYSQKWKVIPFNLQAAGIGLMFFYVGNVMFPFIRSGLAWGRNHGEKWMLILMLTVVLYVLDLHYLPRQWLDLGSNRYNFESLTGSFLGFAIVLMLSVFLCRIPFLDSILELIGKNSMVILVLHTMDMAYLRNWSEINAAFVLLTFPIYLGITYVYVRLKSMLRRKRDRSDEQRKTLASIC